jgi:hypothetical protein
VTIAFDFRLHADRSGCSGTQYFEFVPGPYRNAHWVPGARFIHEDTFCLFEAIFEKRVPDYDHFAYVNVPRPQWSPILRDISELRARLHRANEIGVDLPYGSTLRVEEAFAADLQSNLDGLSTLLTELEGWLHETLIVHDCISILGL